MDKSEAIVLKVTGIAGVVVLEAIALLKGIDGKGLAAAIGAISAIVGYSVRVVVKG